MERLHTEKKRIKYCPEFEDLSWNNPTIFIPFLLMWGVLVLQFLERNPSGTGTE